MYKSVAITALSLFLAPLALAAQIVDFQLVMLSGNKTRLAITLDETAPQPQSYSINDPAWIVVDLAGTTSALEERNIELNSGNVLAASVAEAGGKVRLSVSLTEMSSYNVFSEGNVINIDVDPVGVVSSQTQTALSSAAKSSNGKKVVNDIEFHRGVNGDALVSIDFGSTDVNAVTRIEGDRIVVLVPEYTLADGIAKRYDVVDYATAVNYINATREGDAVRIEIEPTGFYDYLSYQVGSKLSIEVKQLTEDEADEQQQSRFPYSGEKLTMNFQDIDVRDALQIIAEYNDLNLIASDSIEGKLTLRLKNVPWDQSLDLVLKTKGLDKRLSGNVLRVAPAAEIAAQEKLELESNRQVEQLAPLRTEFLQINYAKAADIAEILQSTTSDSGGTFGLLTNRGTIKVDVRTKTLMIHDTDAAITKIKKAVLVFDVPVRQVQIEARIVVARTSIGKELGIKWGGSGNSYGHTANNSTPFIIGGSGSIDGVVDNVNTSIAGGGNSSATYPDALMVNLPVSNPSASSIAVGLTALDYVLDLELSALETTGRAEVQSQPKILTLDGKAAKIQAGTEIPYSTAEGIQFRSAVLSLEVTPQITPDGRIVMDLIITKDSVGAKTDNGLLINKNEINTQVLVDDGETIVLGGIYQVEEVESIDKTPFLGDLPFIGNLFKRTVKSEEKNELLIFVTPRLVDEALTVR
jgi:type IV pilus assembly protein PilQ